MSSRCFTPIIALKYGQTWDIELLNELLHPFEGSDDFTYTMRLSVPEEKREGLKAELEKRGAADLVKTLDEHDWDVSFLVDCW